MDATWVPIVTCLNWWKIHQISVRIASLRLERRTLRAGRCGGRFHQRKTTTDCNRTWKSGWNIDFRLSKSKSERNAVGFAGFGASLMTSKPSHRLGTESSTTTRMQRKRWWNVVAAHSNQSSYSWTLSILCRVEVEMRRGKYLEIGGVLRGTNSVCIHHEKNNNTQKASIFEHRKVQLEITCIDLHQTAGNYF